MFGDPDAPHGHMHIIFDNVRVPASNMLLGEGRGFEISQLRLGPGRIHHCMRAIGSAEKALDLMVTRGMTREAFGKPLVQLGGNLEIISRARIDIEAMRLMVLKAAKAMDVLGNREARVWIHMVKAMVPERVCEIIDQAIQMHGALGVSQHTPLARMYANDPHPADRRRPGRGPPHGGRPQRAAAVPRDAGRPVDRGGLPELAQRLQPWTKAGWRAPERDVVTGGPRSISAPPLPPVLNSSARRGVGEALCDARELDASMAVRRRPCWRWRRRGWRMPRRPARTWRRRRCRTPR